MAKAVILHQENSVTPFTLGVIHRGFHHRLHQRFLKPFYFKNSFIAYKNYSVNWYGNWDNFIKMANKLIANLKKDPDFSQCLLKETIKVGEKLFKEDKRISKLDLVKLSNKELITILNKLYQLGNDICDLGLVAVTSDLRHSKLSNLLKEIIKEKLTKYKLKRKVNDYFSVLLSPTKRGLAYKEKLAILKIAKQLRKNEKLSKLFKNKSLSIITQTLKEKYPRVYQQISKIEKDFNWLVFGHLGPAKTFKQYLEEIKDFLKGGKINKEYNSLISEQKELISRQNKYTKELQLNIIEKRLFKAARDFSYNKIYRFDMLLFTFYTLDRLLKEIAKRVGFTPKELCFTSPEEITKLLEDKKSVTKSEIKKRQQYCVTVIKSKGVFHLTGQKAKNYIKNNTQALEVKKDITTIHGSVAYIGRVSGVVKIVNSVKDISKIKKGDILVSVQTNPNLLPAMKKAAAFVTDIGGITSHAAIVAREMKKPCIIGTKIATKILKDGDQVEVNAQKGDVIKLE